MIIWELTKQTKVWPVCGSIKQWSRKSLLESTRPKEQWQLHTQLNPREWGLGRIKYTQTLPRSRGAREICSQKTLTSSEANQSSNGKEKQQ